MTPAARILALIVDELHADYDGMDNPETFLTGAYLEERVRLLLADIDAERAEAVPVWSPG